jgi:hypothetical protein
MLCKSEECVIDVRSRQGVENDAIRAGVSRWWAYQNGRKGRRVRFVGWAVMYFLAYKLKFLTKKDGSFLENIALNISVRDSVPPVLLPIHLLTSDGCVCGA